MSSPFTVAAGSLLDFEEALSSSTRILALLGAGLSASSGLPTFRGAGDMWKTHSAMSLATPQAFRRDPGLVWQFYSYRRHMALQAKPNPAHYALAQLARRKDGFLTLTQNADEGFYSQRTEPYQACPNALTIRWTNSILHGNLFDIKCFENCGYFEKNNLKDPIVPALAVGASEPMPSCTDRTGAEATATLYDTMGIGSTPATSNIGAKTIPTAELPHCPHCNGLLRPGVVWFNEELSHDMLADIDKWLNDTDSIDLMFVIGTAATVYPAAGYISRARAKGARVAIINMDSSNLGATGSLRERDFMFLGDSGVIVPSILKGVIGELNTGS